MSNNKKKDKKIIFIVIMSTSLGGTEKRFIELWDYFQEQKYDNIRLIITRKLYEYLSSANYLRYLYSGNRNLLIINAERKRDFLKPLINVIKKTNNDVIFHYPLLTSFPFLNNIFRQKFIISFTHNDFNSAFGTGLVSIRRRLFFLLRTWGLWKLDVLNPSVFEYLKKFKRYKDKVYLTAASHVDIYRYRPSKCKKNWIIFMGRFIANDAKNALKFARLLPEVNNLLEMEGFKNLKYYILGTGELKRKIRCTIKKYNKNINIACYFEKEPLKILKKSKVFLSLQKYSNYPSRSLLEAIACGNLPVVTDVGETRKIARPNFAEFIKIEFGARELAEAISNILELSSEEFHKKVKMARDFIKKEFNIGKHADYYLDLYELKKD